VDIEEIKLKLKDYNLKAVAKSAGVPYSQLYGWMCMGVTEPKYSMISKVIRYLESQQLGKKQ
jgi:predicted transcriptional regulator